jgi:SAM-dependent methyltransferase
MRKILDNNGPGTVDHRSEQPFPSLLEVGRAVRACRSCGDPRLRAVVDLGSTPIANALVDPRDTGAPDPSYPLNVVFCDSCSLVQLGYELPADAIFDEEYPYFSSVSGALCRHAAAHVDALIASRGLGPDSFAVEVASNDGYLLRNFVAAGIRTLGIDPSAGPAAAAEAIGVPTVVGFFGEEAARAIVAEHGRADVIVANNVMAHVPDLNDFVAGFAVLLADDGVLTVENPYVRDLVEHVEFDTIYHEHYCYYSCSSVDALMRRHGLHLNDVEYFPDLHGGTLRWYVGRTSDRTARCAALLDQERARGVDTPAYYERFAERVRQCQQALRALLTRLRDEGRTVAAYGAAAKGATLLNSTGIDADLIAYVVDRNAYKQGKLMPGCRLPIRPVEVLLESPPDDVLLLAWNFAEEIIAQQQEYLARGGTFHLPVPTPRAVARDRAGALPAASLPSP